MAFTGSLAQSSRLHSIDFRPGRKYRSRGWTLPSYWIASGHFEQNARLSFLERCRKARRGKLDANAYVPATSAREALDFKDLRNGGFLVRRGSANCMPELVGEGSIDYVFSDPPYGDSIAYLELSEMWNVWLNGPTPAVYEQEVVISDAEGRNKTLE
jgi:16S rRNA G966 N2-methylase RsmD